LLLFYFSTTTSLRSWQTNCNRSSSSSSLLFQTNNNKRVEIASIQRFTVGYDKLCKKCPTRLKPRVDTLTEMIMRLPEDDRKQLLANVEQRIAIEQQQKRRNDGKEEDSRGIRTPEDVYNFQVEGFVTAAVTRSVERRLQVRLDQSQESLVDESFSDDSKKRKEIDSNYRQQKLESKMEETKIKLRKTTAKLVGIEWLLRATKLLLSKHKTTRDTAFEEGFFDDDEMDKLTSMTWSELKLQILRYQAQKAKFENSRAKVRAKSYATSLKLTAFRVNPL